MDAANGSMVNLNLSTGLKDKVRLYFIRTEESRLDAEVFTDFLNDLSEHKRSVINETMFAETLADCPFFCMIRMTLKKSASDELFHLERKDSTNKIQINNMINRPAVYFKKISTRILTSV